MPRQSRKPSGTGIYHVMMRGINHQNIFEDQEDYYQFLTTMDVMAQSYEPDGQNVADAFGVTHPEQMYHKHILLVDDLITTGETMRSCLQAMKRFRGATFSVFALCKAR